MGLYDGYGWRADGGFWEDKCGESGEEVCYEGDKLKLQV